MIDIDDLSSLKNKLYIINIIVKVFVIAFTITFDSLYLVINLLRARSFNNLGFAYYKSNGEKIYLNLKLSKSNKFEFDLKEEG